MQNKYFKFLIVILALAVVVPQVALAAWWNPFSWNWGWVNRIFHFQQTAQKQEQKQDNSKNDIAPNNFASSTGQNSGSSTQNQKATEDWKTYTNIKLGFEFKYPKDWLVNIGAEDGAIYVWTPENKKEFDAGNKSSAHSEFSVIFWEKEAFLNSASEAAKKTITGAKDFVESQFNNSLEAMRDGKKAYAGIVTTNRPVYIEYVEANNGFFVMTVSYPEDATNNPKTKINGQILSSFKFLN